MMKRRVKGIMMFFFGLFTVCLLVYASLFVLLDTITLRQLHDTMPVMSYISSFLGVYDISYQYDEVYEIKQRIGANLEDFIDRQQSDAGSRQGDHWLRLVDTRSEIALYAPVWQFAGETSSNLTSLRLIFSHKGREMTRSFDIPRQRTLDGYRWQYEVHVGKESLFNGINDYLIEARFADGEVVTRKVTLLVDYQRIEVADTIVYIDPTYIPADATDDIVREAPDFAGEMTHFITYGCDVSTDAPDILIQQGFQYRSVPACLSFSLTNNYLLQFVYRQQTHDAWEYDIVSDNQQKLFTNFPLFYNDLHRTYMSLVFRDPSTEQLRILKSRGDIMSYALEIIYYDPRTQRTLVTITHTDGNKLLVENEKEKMYVYMYKDWSYTRGLLYPGVRYKFWYQGKEINQGPMYTLPIAIYGPQNIYGSSFQFHIFLDGTRLYIDDGIKRMSFDIYLIGQTIEVEDIDHPQAQPDVCDTIRRDIYQNTRGDDLVGARFSDSLWLTAAGVHAPGAAIYHEETDTLFAPEQLYKGWLHFRISRENNALVPGNNTYVLKVYNEKQKEICSLEKTIIVE